MKVCKQKEVGRDASRGLCGALPMTLALLGYTWLLLVCWAFFSLVSAVSCKFAFGLFLGHERKQESKGICFSRFFITKLLKSWHL